MSLTLSNINKKLTISTPPPFKFHENPFGVYRAHRNKPMDQESEFNSKSARIPSRLN